MGQHFLFVASDSPGHINPVLHLCHWLGRAAGARITISTSIASHRRMFPSSADQEVDRSSISYIPYSDGFDDGYKPGTKSQDEYYRRSRSVGSESLAAVLRSLEERGRPVTCVIYTLLMAWASDVARDHGVPAVLFWIQPAAVFAIYYHFFHGFDGLITAHSQDPQFAVSLPGLPAFEIRELPTLLAITDSQHPFAVMVRMMKDHFDALDREAESNSTSRVLVNTLEELEPEALAIDAKIKLIPIGPVAAFSLAEGLERGEEAKNYIEWLDTKPVRSVVYVSYGTFVAVTTRQAEEISRGLRASGRPYLWVVRKENRAELEAGGELKLEEERGIVVEWCEQVRVLSHPAVGCFVTHCGWNSTAEALACGVQIVAVPKWADQPTNAKLIEMWGTGVRAEIDGEGVVEAAELGRCLEMVMGEEEGGAICQRARAWKEKVRMAAGEGGSSDRNLRAFVEELASGNM